MWTRDKERALKGSVIKILVVLDPPTRNTSYLFGLT
jgi:hypothetical protein